ncbi:hypothetical protein ACG0Z6_14950 [Roseateles sp. BYS180W]|uniref:Restriction endonuclease n=1 Tax=Roseateles rivi TaxID=3299028 RepID=A0ABW7FZ06_9BURK
MNTQLQIDGQSLAATQEVQISNIRGIASRLKDAGTTSLEMGLKKKLHALQWVYRWGWSSPSLIDTVASPNRRGLAKRLIEQGFLNSYPNQAGGERGIPRQAVCLTEKGQEFVEMRIEEAVGLLDQRHEGDIPWHQLRHDFLVQQTTVKMLADGQIISALSPKEFAGQSKVGIKQPDAVWILGDGIRLGIELELTRKKDGRELNQTVLALIKSIGRGCGDGRVDMVAIFSGSNAILQNYRECLKPGAEIKLYDRDTSRRWVEVGVAHVPDYVAGKFHFRKIDV